MNGKKPKHRDFDLRFVSALDTKCPLTVCVIMHEIIHQALNAFQQHRMPHDAWIQLEIVNQLLKQSFLGKDAPPLFDMYGKLGGYLCKIGYVETGTACIKLFAVYGYRPINEWPFAKAREQGETPQLIALGNEMEEINMAEFDRSTLPEIVPVQIF